MKEQLTIGEALIEALKRRNVQHVFGIPGDYALGFFDDLVKSELDLINTCDEQSAGFAADAYARLRGLGVVAVTYGVGGLKLVNSTAQAFAERSPVVVISGAPGVGEISGDALLHHRVRDFGTQMRVFSEVTVAQARLDDAEIAQREIERVLDAAETHKRPIYIEVPRDQVHQIAAPSTVKRFQPSPGDDAALTEAIEEATEMLNTAANPVILAGVEVHRFGLQDDLIELIEKSRIPFATTIMGKSVISEERDGFLGVYAGGLSQVEVNRAVETSDCVLNLGAMITDLNTGIFTAALDPAKMIAASADVLTIRRHQYANVDLRSFLQALCKAELEARDPLPPSTHAGPAIFRAKETTAITVSRVFDCLDAELSDDIVVISDPGDALFGAIDLTIHSRSEFLACAYYASLGFAVPAAIGVQLANDNWRPLVIVGDGAFQMTGIEISTAVRYGLSPIVLVLDNFGYGTERPMLDGPFNDVHPWHISALTKLINSGHAFEVLTEGDLVEALEAGLAMPEELVLIHVKLASDDFSPALNRLTSNLKARV
ncbi:MAG: thiamine pyrophosphate-binding protein [Pseudomonadota bacterium]